MRRWIAVLGLFALTLGVSGCIIEPHNRGGYYRAPPQAYYAPPPRPYYPPPPPPRPYYGPPPGVSVGVNIH